MGQQPQTKPLQAPATTFAHFFLSSSSSKHDEAVPQWGVNPFRVGSAPVVRDAVLFHIPTFQSAVIFLWRGYQQLLESGHVPAEGSFLQTKLQRSRRNSMSRR